MGKIKKSLSLLLFSFAALFANCTSSQINPCLTQENRIQELNWEKEYALQREQQALKMYWEQREQSKELMKNFVDAYKEMIMYREMWKEAVESQMRGLKNQAN